MGELTQAAYQRFYAALNTRLQTVWGGRFADLCRPTAIALLLTERCNARCVHCNIWQNRGQEDSPSQEQWLSVVSQVREWLGPVYLTFTGGEALLRPFTIAILDRASQIGLAPELLTHGFWGEQTRIEQAALANPWRITLSLDGIGAIHDRIRGREGFFDRTTRSVATLLRLRRERGLRYRIRFKTVIMAHNQDQLSDLARFATREGVDIYYQPIEQPYNSAQEDPTWYLTSENWPQDTAPVVAAVEELIDLKRRGLHIANTEADLRGIQQYFQAPRDGGSLGRYHAFASASHVCAALGMLQIQANGDVRVCSHAEPVGNIKTASLRDIWVNRPKLWRAGCCRDASEAGMPQGPVVTEPS